MLLGLSAALAATICYGLASVLQARAARGVPRRAGRPGRPGSPMRVMVSSSFLLGVALDTVGFGVSVVALRTLTLFAVQAVTNTSLAVTAVTAVWLLAVRLRGRDVAALVTVCAGLVMLSLGSGPQGGTPVGPRFHLGLLAAAIAAVVLAPAVARIRHDSVAALLALLAGTGFGLVSVAVRVLDHLTPAGVLADPATYALVVGGLGGYLCYVLALQRGAVTAVTAAVIVGETVVPGLIGVIALGDRARPGFAWAAVLGFGLALGGTFALARFGELPARGGDSPNTGGTALPGPEARGGSGTGGVHPGGLDRPPRA